MRLLENLLPDDLIRDAKEKAERIENLLSPFGYTFQVCGYWQRKNNLSFDWLKEWWKEPQPWCPPPRYNEDKINDRLWYWDKGLAKAIEMQTGSHAAYECPLKPIEVISK